MPDFKFRGGKFYFSILNESGGSYPLLIPRINNPDFLDLDTFRIKSLPGIVQLLNGELGITEMVMGKILDPLLKTVTKNPLLAKTYANLPFPEDVFPAAVQSLRVTSPEEIAAKAKRNFLRTFIPKDSGLKALEKTVISSLMESYKPLIELLKFLIEILAVAEDIVCMFFGTSIRLFGHNIGFPSRNPKFWNPSLGYATTINYALREFDSKVSEGLHEFDKRMGANHPLSTIQDQPITEAINGTDEREALYVGYFDQHGTPVDPPTWVKNSHKWFRKEYVDATGQPAVVSAPFAQLATDVALGSAQLRAGYERTLGNLDADRAALLAAVSEHVVGDASASADATRVMDSFVASIQDTLNGTNLISNNFRDPDNPSAGVNPPAPLQEWMGKVHAGQLRTKYYPAPVSTVQELTNGNGEPVEPFVYIPQAAVTLAGITYGLEAPLAFDHQLRYHFQPGGLQFDGVPQRRYVDATRLDPRYELPETRFSHQPTGITVPDVLKRYFLPLEWEEITEYNVVNKVTREVVRVETEVVPYKIDLEGDYELRLIQVVNRVLSADGVTGGRDLGTVHNRGNTIPPAYEPGVRTNHSTPDRDATNLLKEGVVEHGIDPRFPQEPYFWLVEALKKSVPADIAPLNGEFHPRDLAYADEQRRGGSGSGSGGGGKEWYGLLDRFRAFPRIFGVLLPIIVRKAIPLIIKIIRLISNPSQIGKFLIEMGLTDEAISKFPQAFPAFSNRKGLREYLRVANFPVPTSLLQSKRLNVPRGEDFYAGLQYMKLDPRVKSMIEGQAVAEFGKGAFGKALFSFGVNLDFNTKSLFTFITKKTPRTDFTVPPVVAEQPVFGMILNLLKMPFETIFMIFMWFIDWFKRLLNPLNIPKAIADLLSFKWLRDIFGKKSLFAILGIKDPLDDAALERAMLGLGESLSAVEGKKTIDAILQSLRESESGYSFGKFVEVFVYNFYRNGEFVKSETEQRAWNADVFDQDSFLQFGNTFMGENAGGATTAPGGGGDALSGVDAGLDEARRVRRKYGSDRYARKCGLRNFDLGKLFPNPFWSDMPHYNRCELPQVAIKPLEMVSAILNLIQEFLNALISMPAAILGLEPTIRLPRFGKEIPFADIFDQYLSKIKERLNASASPPF